MPGNGRGRPGKSGLSVDLGSPTRSTPTQPSYDDAQPFQVMPPLTDDEYAALQADIAEHGVLVPITVDQHGAIIDGHHRAQIAAELGIPREQVVRVFSSDEERYDTALGLNLKRRHLTREQMRELIATECQRTPDASDREIARRLGCSPSTVGTVRRPMSNLDTPESVTEEERRPAEELTRDIQRWLTDWDRLILDMFHECLGGAVPPANLAKFLQRHRVKWLDEIANYPTDILTILDERFFCGWLDELAAVQALWQGWKVVDEQWSVWLETWAQTRPAQHRETTDEWRDAMAELADLEQVGAS
jgi:hypothetical protein